MTLGRRSLLTGAGAAGLSSTGVFGLPDGLARAASSGRRAGNPVSVVETTAGKVRGYRDQGVQVFKGIPYGDPVSGAGRYLPAKPRTSWPGVLETVDFGPISMQLGSGSISGGRQSEDCLFLNVWTPSVGRAHRRPVMVYMHGGGFRVGSPLGRYCDGTNLAAAGDVVVVSMSHRLGGLAYMYLGDVFGGAYEAGNAGNLDIVLALQWVRDNIEAFGGDPARVMVFGESGGGKKISHLLAMPAARGLFHRALIESGALSTAIERPAATDYAHRFLAALRLTANDRGKLAEVPVETLLATQAQLTAAGYDAAGSYGGSAGPEPVVDGHTLPMHPGAAVAGGMSADVPLIIGSMLDEAGLGFAMPQYRARYEQMTDAGLRDQLLTGLAKTEDDHVLADMGPGGVEAVIAHYRRVWPDAPNGMLAVRIEAAAHFRRLSYKLADFKAKGTRAPVRTYVVTCEAQIPGSPLRAAGHGMDVPLIMRNVEAGSVYGLWGNDLENAWRLSDTLSATMVAFARDGIPQAPGLPAWTPLTATDHWTMLFDLPSKVVRDPFGDAAVFGGVQGDSFHKLPA